MVWLEFGHAKERKGAAHDDRAERKHYEAFGIMYDTQYSTTEQASEQASKRCRNIDVANMSMCSATISHPPSLARTGEASLSSYSLSRSTPSHIHPKVQINKYERSQEEHRHC